MNKGAVFNYSKNMVVIHIKSGGFKGVCQKNNPQNTKILYLFQTGCPHFFKAIGGQPVLIHIYTHIGAESGGF